MRRRGRRSLREQLEAVHADQCGMAAMMGKPPPPLPKMLVQMGPKRTRKLADPHDNEATVLAAVGELLHAHPRVLLAIRQNSGSMAYEGKDGRAIPVWFYKIIRQPDGTALPRDGGGTTLTDYWGFLKDCRPFAIECKRPSWKWSDARNDSRETKQQAFIHLIQKLGGVGGFARSVDEAQSIIEREEI